MGSDPSRLINKYRYCSRHMVVMTWFDQDVRKHPEDPWRYFAVSGFVMSFLDQWYLATAGHILSQMEENRLNGLTRVRSMGLVDHGGVEAVHKDSFPFDYDDAKKFFVEGDGLDFGFVEIKAFYRRLLEANSVAPISEQHWDREDDEVFEEHVVLGCPSSQHVRLGGIGNGGSTLQGHAQFVVLPVERLSDAEAPQTTQNRVFYGRLRDNKVNDIDGFSGGPLIGLGPKLADGRVPYRVIAMQFAWNRSTRTILASPLRVFGPLFQKHCGMPKGKHTTAVRKN